MSRMNAACFAGPADFFFLRMTHAPYFFHERVMISVHKELIEMLLAKSKTVTANKAREVCCWQLNVDTVFIIFDIIEIPRWPEICQIW